MSGVSKVVMVLFASNSVSKMMSSERSFSHYQTYSSFATLVPLKNPLKNSNGPLRVKNIFDSWKSFSKSEGQVY